MRPSPTLPDERMKTPLAWYSLERGLAGCAQSLVDHAHRRKADRQVLRRRVGIHAIVEMRTQRHAG